MLEPNDLGKWKVAPFAFEGDVDVRDGVLNTGLGSYLTGVVWSEEAPATMDYEIELEARIVYGSDFFLGLTVPVRESHCTWIVGGWGGTVVGISSVDGYAADYNETTREMSFEKERWYHFRMRVKDDRIRCWIDGKRVVNLDTRGKQISLRYGPIEDSVPLGISSYDTEAEYRNIFWRNLD